MAILGGGATRAATLEVEVRADTDKAEATLSRFGDRLGGSIKKGAAIAGAALAGVGIAGVAGISKAIGAASDLNEIVSKSNTVFGRSGKEMEAWAGTAARSFGQSKAQALDAAGSFGNMFVQLGIGQQEAAKMSRSMTELASDFASFHNADITEVLTAQQAAFRGEYDALQRFVPTINAAAVEQQALKMGLGATTAELDAQDKALATQALMMAGAGDAMGDFKRTQGGLANSTRTLSALWGDFMASIGQKFLPIGLALVRWAMSLLDALPKLGNAFKWLAKGDAQGFAEIMDSLLGNSGKYVGMFRSIGNAVLGFIGWVKDAASFIAGLVEAWGGWGEVAKTLGIILGAAGLAGAVLKVVSAVKEAKVMFSALKIAMAANPATVWIIAIGALVAALVIAYQKSEAFRDVVDSVFRFIRTTVVPIVEEFVAAVVENFRALWTNVQEVWPSVQETIVHVINVVSGIITTVVGVLSALWDQFGATIMDVVGVAFNFISNHIQSVMQVIRGIILVVTGLINGDWSAVWDGIKAIFGGVWDGIKNILGTAMGFMRETIQAGLGFIDMLWDQTFGRMLTFVADTFAGIGNAVGDGISAVGSAIGRLPGLITGILGSVGSAAVSVGRKIIDGLGEGISKVGSFVGDVAGAVGKGIKDAINGLIGLLNAAIPNKLGWGRLSINIPDDPIPKLHAMGGVFSRPHLGMVAEAGREAILPLTRPGRMREILSDPRVAAAVAAALPWAQMAGRAIHSAASTPGAVVHNTRGQTAGDGPLIGQLILQGSDMTADDVMRAAAWAAHTREPVAGKRG